MLSHQKGYKRGLTMCQQQCWTHHNNQSLRRSPNKLSASPHTHTCSTSTCVSHSTSRFFSYIGFISCSLLRETADVFSKLETLSRNKCQPLSVVYHCDIQHSLHTGYTVTNKLSGQRERNIIFPHYITALSWTIDPL